MVSKNLLLALFLALCILSGLLGCHEAAEGFPSDTDTGSNTDTESEFETETDSSSDSDTGSDVDSDIDTDTGTDTGPDTGAESDQFGVVWGFVTIYGAPFVGVVVRAHGSENQFSEYTLTDENGRYELTLLVDTYDVYAGNSSHWSMSEAVITEDCNIQVDIEIN